MKAGTRPSRLTRRRRVLRAVLVALLLAASFWVGAQDWCWTGHGYGTCAP